MATCSIVPSPPRSLCLYLLRPRRCDQRVQTRHRSRLEALRPCLALRPCSRRLGHWCSSSSSPLAFALALACPLRGLRVGCIVLQYRCEGVEPSQLSRGVPVREGGRGRGRMGRHMCVRKQRIGQVARQTNAVQAGGRCGEVPAEGKRCGSGRYDSCHLGGIAGCCVQPGVDPDLLI